MRPDMPKVIVERPRRGSTKRARPGRAIPLEDDDGEPLRARAPIVRKIRTKSLNENLAPLKRYLAAQVGRPWAKVYSEISANLKPSNTVQQHVRDHVEDFVGVKSRMKGGKVLLSHPRWGESPLDQDWRKLYVHPRTGLLCRNDKAIPWRRSRKIQAETEAAELAQRMRAIGPLMQLHLLDDGCWWEVTLARCSRGLVTVKGHSGPVPAADVDVVRRAKLSGRELHLLYGRYGVYAVDKRILSKAEKKRHNLR
jgi:hypothetical protein